MKPKPEPAPQGSPVSTTCRLCGQNRPAHAGVLVCRLCDNPPGGIR